MLTQPVRNHVFDSRQDNRRILANRELKAPRLVRASIEVATGNLLDSELRVCRMIPPALPVHSFIIIYKARCSHGFIKSCIIACDHVKIRRHESTVRVDRCGSPTDQYGHFSGCPLKSRKSIGQGGQGSKIFGR